MADATQPLAASYARQSRGKAKSIEEQAAENRAAAEASGWQLVVEYSDGSSASRFATKTRTDWGKVVADVEARRFDYLILWESSRGDRTLTTWSQLLESCRQAGVQIYVTSHNRAYNMSVDRDWRSMAEDGVDSDYEARKISGRMLRGHAGAAQRGRPAMGRTAYGFRRQYDARTGDLAGQEAHPEDGLIVIDIITRIAAAEPLAHILRDLDKRKVITPGARIELDAIEDERREIAERDDLDDAERAAELADLDQREREARSRRWARTTLRTIATNPAYVGRRRHNGTTYDGLWKPLVDPGIFDSAQRVLANPARRREKPGRNLYLLSYIINCAECGSTMHYKTNPRVGQPTLVCHDRGCTAIRADWLDEYVTDLVLGRLAKPDIYRALTAVDDAGVLAARAEVEALRRKLDEHRDSAALPDGISAESLARIEARILPLIKAAEERARQAMIPPQLRHLLEPGADVRERWGQLTVPAQKEIVKLLLDIRVRKAAKRGSVVYFDPDRVEIAWREIT